MENLNNQSVEYFDKQHNEFRSIVFQQFIQNMKKKYVNLVRFSGDSRFTIAMQRQLLRSTFEMGVGCVFDLSKSLLKNIEIDGFYEFEKLIKTNYSIKPLGVSASRWDENNRVVKGFGITATRHNTGIKQFPVDKDNSAFLQFEDYYASGITKWMAFAYMWSTAQTIAKKRMVLLDKKFVANNANNSYSDATFQDLYDVAKSFFDSSPSQSQSLTSEKTLDLDITKLLSQKLAKLDLSSNESINDLMSFIDENSNQWNHLFGIRTNTNKKGERNISDEFNAEEVHFGLMQNDFKDQINMFVEEYKQVFNIQLIPTFIEDKIIKEYQQHQRAMSGGGKDREGGDHDANSSD